MRRIILSAGHSNVPGLDQGRQTKDYSEGIEAAYFRRDLANKLKGLGLEVLVDPDSTVLKDSIDYFKHRVDIKDIAIDIHFNGFDNPAATGTEVLIPNYASNFEIALAGELTVAISKCLNIKDRGIKSESTSHHGKLGWMRLNCETVLVELCFITNENDMKAYKNKYWLLIDDVAKVLKNASTW